jgi:hypothetical protein
MKRWSVTLIGIGVLLAPSGTRASDAAAALAQARAKLGVVAPAGRFELCLPSDDPDTILVCAPADTTDRFRATGSADRLGKRYQGQTLEQAAASMRFIREATLLDQAGMLAGVWAGPGYDPQAAPKPLTNRQRLRDTCGKAMVGAAAGFGTGLLCGAK